MMNGRTNSWTVLGAIWLTLGFFGACKSDEKLPDLGNRISGPTDVVSSPSGAYFYVLNSDYERRFDEGSLLVIDPAAADGNYKAEAIETRRLGRSMHVAQNLMLIAYDAPDAIDRGHVELWTLADERRPALLQTWDIACAPSNAILAPTRAYFAVTCTTGDLYLGAWTATPADATVDLVRAYGYEHRALYFHEGSDKVWLFGFPSGYPSAGLNTADDVALDDRKTYVEGQDTLLDQANVVPDPFEETPQARRRSENGLPFQMFIYDVTSEEAASAALRTEGDDSFQRLRFVAMGNPFAKPTQANRELNYVHYTLREASGELSGDAATVELYTRFYRTNFWDAKARTNGDAGTFYLSQRGRTYGSAANNVLELRVNEGALNQAAQNKVPFDEIFSVNRVYGFTQDRDSPGRFPGDFEFVELAGEPMLIINHFRDLTNFKDAPFYSLTRKFLSSSRQLERPSSVDSTAYESSYYQLAVNSAGKVLTCSYYGGSLFLFDVDPRISIKDQIPIRIE